MLIPEFSAHDVDERQFNEPEEPALKVLTDTLGLDGLEVVQSSAGSSLIGFSKYGVFNPLARSVCLAYAGHYPLAISPDALWLCIASGVATHQRIEDSKTYGDRKTISLNCKSFNQETDWLKISRQLYESIGELEPKAPLYEPDFSTTNDNDRTAGRIMALSAYNARYRYEMRCICGLPRIMLTGTPDDWHAIRERAKSLTDGGLEWWQTELLPILDQFASAATGEPDKGFWKDICQTTQTYGSHLVGGWITKLFPYVGFPRSEPVKNPMLVGWKNYVMTIISEPKTDENGKLVIGKDGDVIQVEREVPALHPTEIPHGLSYADVTIVDDTGLGNADMNFRVSGGLVGVEKTNDGFLKAKPGWVARRSL